MTDRASQARQLELPVLGAITTSSARTPSKAPSPQAQTECFDHLRASAEDQSIYDAIVANYFRSLGRQ